MTAKTWIERGSPTEKAGGWTVGGRAWDQLTADPDAMRPGGRVTSAV